MIGGMAAARRTTRRRSPDVQVVRFAVRLRARNVEAPHIVSVFFEILNTIKLYHWNTRSFAQHKATDELYAKLNDNMDRFVEIMLGKRNEHIDLSNEHARMVDTRDLTEIKDKIHEYRTFFQDMGRHFTAEEDSDLLSVRDDILGDLNQFLYLLSFDAPPAASATSQEPVFVVVQPAVPTTMRPPPGLRVTRKSPPPMVYPEHIKQRPVSVGHSRTLRARRSSPSRDSPKTGSVRRRKTRRLSLDSPLDSPKAAPLDSPAPLPIPEAVPPSITDTALDPPPLVARPVLVAPPPDVDAPHSHLPVPKKRTRSVSAMRRDLNSIFREFETPTTVT
jgi:hypothetical protein